MSRGAGFHGSLSNVDVSSDRNIDHLNIDKSARLHRQVLAAIIAAVGKGGGTTGRGRTPLPNPRIRRRRLPSRPTASSFTRPIPRCRSERRAFTGLRDAPSWNFRTQGPAQVLQIQETDQFAGLDGLYIMGAIVYSIGEAALPSNSVWPTC